VSAPFETADNASGTFSEGGNVYTFSSSNGVYQRTLASPNAQTDGEFGFSVAASASIVIGAPGENSGAGSVYNFKLSTGALSSTLTHGSGAFGDSVAELSAIIVIGAPKQTASGETAAGHAYVY
jgi:FG-GAP repeat